MTTARQLQALKALAAQPLPAEGLALWLRITKQGAQQMLTRLEALGLVGVVPLTFPPRWTLTHRSKLLLAKLRGETHSEDSHR